MVKKERIRVYFHVPYMRFVVSYHLGQYLWLMVFHMKFYLEKKVGYLRLKYGVEIGVRITN